MNSEKQTKEKEKDKKNKNSVEEKEGERRRGRSNSEGVATDAAAANPSQGNSFQRGHSIESVKAISTTDMDIEETMKRSNAYGEGMDSEGLAVNVGTQANYNWESVIDPTVRRSSLARTPPMSRKTSTGSGVDGVTGITATGSVTKEAGDQDFWQDEEGGSPIYKLYYGDREDTNARPESSESPITKKRKRDPQGNKGTPTLTTDKVMSEVLQVIEDLTKCSVELQKQVDGSKKTKNEIKEATTGITSIVEELNRKMAALKSSYGLLTAKAGECQNPPATVAKDRKPSRSIGLQANEDEIKRDLSDLKEKVREEVTKQLDSKSGWDGLASVIDHLWPEGCFQNTKMVGAEELQAARGNVAIIMNPDHSFTGEIAQYIRINFPDIQTLLNDKIEEGKIEYIKTQVKTVISGGAEEERTRILYILPYKMSSDGVNDTKKLYEVLQKLEGETAALGTAELKLAVAGNCELEYIRKCSEFVFHGTDRKVDIIRSGVRKKDKPIGLGTEKIFIRSEGKQYADVLRTIKSNVDIDRVGVKIKTIKKTYNGDIMLEVQGGKAKAEALMQEIQNKNDSTRVTIKSTEDTLLITDIDGDVQADDVRKAIIERIEIARAEEVKILSLKPNQFGAQTAAVSLRKDVARELLKAGTIRIGWAPCRIKTRVNIVRCYRCLGFGHYTRECTGADNTNVCLRCGKENHKAKDCQNAVFCLTCKKEGHRADQSKCPEFKKLLKAKTKEADPPSRPRQTRMASTSNRKNGH